MENRDQNLKLYEHLYKKLHTKEGPFCCFYCGNLADGWDHVPPLSRVNDYKALHLVHEIYFKVPCCAECNCILSNSLQDTLEDRIEYLKDELGLKYRKLLSTIWTEKRVKREGYKGQLKRYLIKVSREQELIISRLRFNGGIKAYRDRLLEVY